MVGLDDFRTKDDEVVTGISDAPKNIWTSLKIYSQIYLPIKLHVNIFLTYI